MLNLPTRLKSFLLKFLLCLALLSICRFLFLLFNHSFFTGPGLEEFYGGLRFDLSTLGYLLLPLLFLHLLFFIPWTNRIYQGTIRFFFYLPVLFIIVLSCIDLEYFKFTFKRSSSDLFQLLFLSDDVENQSFQILLDYWYVAVVALLLIALVILFHKKTLIKNKRSPWQAWLLWTPILLLAMVVFARGGFQLKPLDVIHAGNFSGAQNIPLVLNSPFTFIKSLGKDQLQLVHFFTEDELQEIYSPIQEFETENEPKKLNVVLIILEGFSSEYIGFLNDYRGYTPFLDSLMKESLVFTNAFSNGKKSIESLPAILSGIPTLSDNPYISSNYSGNRIMSLPQVLEEYDYNSSFYHGGANGTMGFDAFAGMAGIDNYFGLNEFPDRNEFYDGNWGIFDEAYFTYFNEELGKKKQPFISCIFTLSSHHPYTIPENYKDRFPKGTLDIHESIAYADYSLRKFFEEAKKENYYSNTLFVLVADHTAQTDQAEYQSRAGMFRIPLIFHYKDELKGKSAIITQQADIFPSVVDFLNLDTKILSFGNSVFEKNTDHFAINYLNGLYQFIEDDYSLLFDGENPVSLININSKGGKQKNLLGKKVVIAKNMEKKLKAIIQQYNNRVIQNQLSIK